MLKEIKIKNFKSFRGETVLKFPKRVIGIVGPNGSGKSNITEAFRFVLGEQSIKTLRGRKGIDLIFNGGTENKPASKFASVSVTFDNNNSNFKDYLSTVTIERTVLQDGTNIYKINDTEVKQREVIELLASVNLGSTGHHIISQGEADRILNGKPIERRKMLEDGLGLKLLQYRKEEAEKKISRAEKFVKETELVQKEILPQLNYLKRQVDRFEKVIELQKNLVELYKVYLSFECVYIKKTKCLLLDLVSNLSASLSKTNKTIEAGRSGKNIIQNEKHEELKLIKEKLFLLEQNKEKLIKEIGRIDGKLDFVDNTNINKNEEEKIFISKNILQNIKIKLLAKVDTYESFKKIVEEVVKELNRLLHKEEKTVLFNEEDVQHLKKELEEKQKELDLLKQQESSLQQEEKCIFRDQEELIKKTKKGEEELIYLLTEKNKLDAEYRDAMSQLKFIENDGEEFERELTEGAVLIGEKAIEMYMNKISKIDFNQKENFTRISRQNRRKELEKNKIILESIGSEIDENVYKEYEELKKRSEFLETERADILSSISDLKETIKAFNSEIELNFTNGVSKINKEFDSLIKTLFGGGSGCIEIIDINQSSVDDEKIHTEKGIEIKISLPRKKIKSLEQLSGGERALVSIALLFAISQITPPPFLVLDETDASLDEANSQRYGDMIEKLSEKSQLLLVTHNRETMYRTDILYGITMNSSGVSKVLSIDFEKAENLIK